MGFLVKNKFSIPVERPTVAENWHRRGYSCRSFVDPPGQEWNDFVHDCNELVTVVEGQLKVTINGETCIAEAGDEIFIPKGAVHSVINVHTRTTRWLYGYD